MNKIIYDSIATGHHSEYISHLVNYILEKQTDDIYYFVVSIEMKEKIPEIVAKTIHSKHIRWDWIPKLETNKLSSYSLIKRSFVELKLVETYATKLKVKEVYLMYFNVFQIALIFKRPKFNIKGILFLQFLRMPRNTFKDKIKYYRKFYITKLYSLNKSIKSIFILNDTKTVKSLNVKFKTTIFEMLPDPIPLYEEEKDFNVHKHYNISSNKKILLHPGAIDPRKGTYEIIESIDFLKEKEINNYAILIVGKAKPEIESIIKNKISLLKNKKFEIIFDNSFVTNERLKSLFLQSNAILMPYKNPEASSGILGHAVATYKPVLAPKTGLLGEIIKENKFGLLVNEVNSEKIAEKIYKIEKFKLDYDLSTKFIQTHTGENFSSIFLNI